MSSNMFNPKLKILLSYKPLMFALLFISNFLSCTGDAVQTSQNQENSGKGRAKVLDFIRSRVEGELVKAYGGAESEVLVDKKFSLGVLKSSMTDFCGIGGDLQTIAGGGGYSPTDTAVFHFDVSLESRYDRAFLWINSAWLPELDSDPLAKVTIVSCHQGANGQDELQRKVIGSDLNFGAADDSGYRAVELDYILDGSNSRQAVPIVLILQGDGIGLRKLPANVRPYVELQSRPQPRPSRAKFTSRPCGQGQQLCCLDSVLLDVKTQLNGTNLAQLGIVEPSDLRVHFCRGGCLDAHGASVIVNTIANHQRPIGGQNCCVPTGFNSIPVVVRDARGHLSNKRLEGIDARGCRCVQ